jgi:hypothetical protein
MLLIEVSTEAPEAKQPVEKPDKMTYGAHYTENS